MAHTPEKQQQPAYRTRINAERSAELFVCIFHKLSVERLYRDPDMTARKLAELLQTNTRYVSAAVATATGGNYNNLVNTLRVQEACRLLRSKRHKDYTAEDIGLQVGFSSRQAFYLAFNKIIGMTPRQYRLAATETPLP